LFAIPKGRSLVGVEEANMPRSTTKDAPGDSAQTPNRLDVALGLRVRQRRTALGLSQTALADSIGLTFQQVQKYERGFNRVSFSRLVDVAHALDCRVVDLIGDLDDASIPSPLFRQDTAHLRAAGAPDLLAAYSKLPVGLRKAVVKLMVELAKAGHPYSSLLRADPIARRGVRD
jgi:transcriptional regulator with XRE-family HTH domain